MTKYCTSASRHPDNQRIRLVGFCISYISTDMAPKAGANAKKESGRAKKAENEAKKKDAAAAEKVCRPSTAKIPLIQRKYLGYIHHRKNKKPRNGRMVLKVLKQARRRERRNARPSSPVKPRMLVCSLRKKHLHQPR